MNGAFLGKRLWAFVCLVLFVAGCASSARVGSQAPPAPPPPFSGQGGAAPAADSAPRGSFNESAPMSATPAPEPPPPPPPPVSASAPKAPGSAQKSGSGGSASASVSADAAAAPRERRADPRPESRPGLGTEFGEARTSRVHDVTFVREEGRPFAIAALNYNDRRGVDALASVEARRDSARSVSSGGGAVTISIRDANGDPLEAVHVGSRTFVVGQAGQRYTIVLENHTSHRFEAVGTVDGLDVINGKPGTFDNRGYVLMPFATLQIEGFRTSTSAVAAFRFAAVADSYAAQTGSARNVGVIGLAFFSERGDAFIPESDTRLRDSASPFPADPRFAQPPRR
jgi:hypothetical protein